MSATDSELRQMALFAARTECERLYAALFVMIEMRRRVRSAAWRTP